MATTVSSSFTRAKTRCANTSEIERQKGAIAESLTRLRETKSTTRDGRHIVLSANIELPDEVDAVLANGAEGVGLYRTEFLYLNQTALPTEEEQFATYRTVAQRVAPDPLIIRTLDLGGDKLSDSMRERGRTQPISGLAGDSFLPRESADFQNAVARHSAGERFAEREDDVPDDLGTG